jgi:1,4-alpha-glucan branching enzyme
MCYYYSENFILSLSHDEVVYGKGSLLGKMPGDLWQKFANLRLLFSYLFTHPGKKLLFMGAELAQWQEWNHDGCLQWDLLQFSSHQGIQELIKDLNHLYAHLPALHQLDHDPHGFQWVHLHDSDSSVIGFLRNSGKAEETLLVLCNFTPMVREHYALNKFSDCSWKLIFNSDDLKYDGSHYPVKEVLRPEQDPFSSQMYVTLAPLATLIYQKC